MDIEEQYDKIYRFCYYKVKNQEVAEDITQETFLRFIEGRTYQSKGKMLQYLYTVARNLCIDEYRRKKTEELSEELAGKEFEDEIVNNVPLKLELSKLTEEERELILLRYVNEVPVAVICKLTNKSRFAIYRMTKDILSRLQNKLRGGE